MKIRYNKKNLKLVSGVYQIRNIKNGKVYIGSTMNFLRRFSEHTKELKRGIHINKHLQNSFNKYKIDMFVIEPLKIIVSATINELRKLEQKCIDDVILNNGKEYCFNNCKKVILDDKKIKQFQYNKTYNIEFINPHNGEVVILEKNISEFCRKNNITGCISEVINGNRNHANGWRLKTPIRIEKTKSEISSKRWENSEYKEKMAEANRRPMPDNVKTAISNALIGNTHFKGKKHTDKTKQKMSTSAKGRVVSVQQRASHSKRMKGRKYSEQHRKNISVGLTGRIQGQKQRDSVSKANEKFFDVVLLSPDGNQHGPFTNLTKFCKEHGLQRPKMHLVIIGTRPHHKGWTLHIPSPITVITNK